MAHSKEFSNPFYFVLVAAGVTFAITACSYGVATFADLQAAEAGEDPVATASAFVRFINERGGLLLGIELLLLAGATFGAIATDQYWQRRQDARITASNAEKPAERLDS